MPPLESLAITFGILAAVYALTSAIHAHKLERVQRELVETQQALRLTEAKLSTLVPMEEPNEANLSLVDPSNS